MEKYERPMKSAKAFGIVSDMECIHIFTCIFT